MKDLRILHRSRNGNGVSSGNLSFLERLGPSLEYLPSVILICKYILILQSLPRDPVL